MPTRNRLVVPALLVPALLAAAACGSGGGSGGTQEQSSAGEAAGTRTVEHAAGTTEIPEDPQRIVATHDQNALLPLLELGVTPVGSAGLIGDDGSETFRRTDGFDTSGIAFTGAYGEPNLEAVAALEPDLIVGQEFDEEFYDDLSRIAPTVLVQVFDRPLTEGLMDFAEVVGREEEAAQLQAEYEQRIADLREQLGDRVDTLSVSVLAAGDPGTFYREDVGQAMGTVMDDLGLPRVAAQEADDGSETLSLEQLGTRDADVVLLVSYAGEDADPGIDAIQDSPTWERLAAVQAGQAHVVDGTQTVGAAWARMGNFLDVLEEHLVPADADVVEEG